MAQGSWSTRGLLLPPCRCCAGGRYRQIRVVEYGRRTKAKGKTVLATQGPIEEMTLNNGCVVADGNYIVGRTSGMKVTVRRAARS